jgi:hypothetical protein
MDTALLLPPLPIAADTRRLDPSLIGCLVGGAVPALVASIAWWFDVTWVAAVASAGIPIGAVVAAIAAPRMAGPDWVGAAVLAGLSAPLVPGVLIALGFLAGSAGTAASSGLDVALGGVFLALVALVFAELGGAPITLPLAFVVALLIRRAALMPARRAAIHVGALVVISGVLAFTTLVAMAGLLAPIGIEPIHRGL